MKTTAERLLCKGRLSEAYDSLPDMPVKEQVLGEYARLLRENDLSDKTVDRAGK
jgi:hypothetical protein